MKNYYRILGLNIDAEHEEIKAAYRILAQRCHPDKGGSNAEFLLIKEAYDILSNPLTKRNYDKDLLNELKQPRAIIKPSTTKNNFALISVILVTVLALAFAVWAYLRAQHHPTGTQDQISSSPLVNNIATTKPMPTQHKQIKSNKKAAAHNSSSAPISRNPFNGLTGEHYILNLGNYSDKLSAQEYQATLKAQGYISSIQKIDANSEGLGGYSIFMGPYSTNDKASQLQNELESQNINVTLEKINFGD